MLKSSLCYYSDAYITFTGAISVANTWTVATPNNRTKKVVFEHCTLFINLIREINNTELDNAKDIDVVMPMYNLT